MSLSNPKNYKIWKVIGVEIVEQVMEFTHVKQYADCYVDTLSGEGSRQRINQHIGLIVILGGIQGIRIGIAVLAVCQVQCFQEIRTLGLVDGVQHFHMAVGAAVIFGLGELDNIRNLEVTELHALDGVAVAGFAVAQSSTGAAQNIVDTSLIEYAGGDIGGIPNAVLFSIGQVILVDGQGSVVGLVASGSSASRSTYCMQIQP